MIGEGACCCRHSHKNDCNAKNFNDELHNHKKHVPMCCEVFKVKKSHSEDCKDLKSCECDKKSHDDTSCKNIEFCTCPKDVKKAELMKMLNLHVAECKYIKKLSNDDCYWGNDKDFFNESKDYPGYYFPCCCGI